MVEHVGEVASEKAPVLELPAAMRRWASVWAGGWIRVTPM